MSGTTLRKSFKKIQQIFQVHRRVVWSILHMFRKFQVRSSKIKSVRTNRAKSDSVLPVTFLAP